jgi:chaperone modulatory protein CbpM
MMNHQSSDVVWINGNEVCQIEHLVEVSGLSIFEIEDLIENDLIIPIDRSMVPHTFALQIVLVVKKARRLKDDFQLDSNGLVLALTLLERIDVLENELQLLRL